MKKMPMPPPATLQPRYWGNLSQYHELYEPEGLVDAVEDFDKLWSKINWKTFQASTHSRITDADKLEKMRKSMATTWAKRMKNVHGQLDSIVLKSRKLIADIPGDKKDAVKPLNALLPDVTRFRKGIPLKFDDSDFLEAIEALQNDGDDGSGGAAGGKGKGKGKDKDSEKEKPIDAGAFRKAAAAIATSAKSGGPPASTVARIHGEALDIIGGHNKDQRAQNRLFKSLMPLGGDKIAKQVANGLKDRAAAKIADSLPDDVAAKLKKVGFNPGSKNENKQKLEKIAKEMDKSTAAIKKALETSYKHIGSLTKAANGNAMMNKKLDETDKLLDIMSRIYGDIESFTGTVTEAAELMKNGKPTNGIRLDKLEADRLAKAFGLLERWAVSWQRMV